MSHLDTFIETLKSKYPYLARVPHQMREDGDEQYAAFAEMITSRLIALNKDPKKAVAAYAQMCTDYLRLQRELERTGRYHYQTFEEAKQHVYDNSEVMEGYYLDGLILSQIWWPNHYRIFRFFNDVFLPATPGAGTACEVGPGHGLFTETFLTAKPQWNLFAYDTSAHSIKYTTSWIEQSGKIDDQRYTLINELSDDGMAKRGDHFDALICGEVLEHLEDPLGFLRNLALYAKPEATFYLTTAMFAANIDHLYLFHSAREARDLIAEAGLEIIHDLVLPVNKGDSVEAVDVPMNYVCTARLKPS